MNEEHFPIKGTAWEPCAEIPGWQIASGEINIDGKQCWGVTIWDGDECRTMVTIPIENIPLGEGHDAKDMAIPALKDFVRHKRIEPHMPEIKSLQEQIDVMFDDPNADREELNKLIMRLHTLLFPDEPLPGDE